MDGWLIYQQHSSGAGAISEIRRGLNGQLSDAWIRKHMMPNKQFMVTNAEEIKTLLLSVKTDKHNGVDNLDGKLLQLSAIFVANPLAYMFNLCFSVPYPQHGKIAKVTPLPKNCLPLRSIA